MRACSSFVVRNVESEARCKRRQLDLAAKEAGLSGFGVGATVACRTRLPRDFEREHDHSCIQGLEARLAIAPFSVLYLVEVFNFLEPGIIPTIVTSGHFPAIR